MKISKIELHNLVSLTKFKSEMSKPKSKVTSVSWLPSDKELQREVGRFLTAKGMGFSDYVRKLVRRDGKNRKRIVSRLEKEAA